ncbi:MAG: DUF1134 domain-containing protein [Hyphomicrobiaceae bacterium]
MGSVSRSAVMRLVLALLAPAAVASPAFAVGANGPVAATTLTDTQSSSGDKAFPHQSDVAPGPGIHSESASGAIRLAQDSYRSDDAYRPQNNGYETDERAYRPPSTRSGSDDAYRPPSGGSSYGSGSAYNRGPPVDNGYGDSYQSRPAPPSGQYGDPYAAPQPDAGRQYEGEGYSDRRDSVAYDNSRHYSQSEIVAAGHGFFGSISKGLANVIEYAFKKAGRPNGYILGEDAGGAFVAGLRYGEGRLYTKDAGTHKVYWQGPSVGYDFGGAGAKTMILVYNLRDPSEIYHRFGGVEGSAYLVGGVSIQFQKYGDVVMAPIRAGVGLRLGANVGYLKYTRRPTWNPF